jgi:hypothetical protein
LRITNPQAGRSHLQKGRRRFGEPGQLRELTITGLGLRVDARVCALSAALGALIDYIHQNPVRRGLVDRADDREWSSARWDASLRPVKISFDASILTELELAVMHCWNA